MNLPFQKQKSIVLNLMLGVFVCTLALPLVLASSLIPDHHHTGFIFVILFHFVSKCGQVYF